MSLPAAGGTCDEKTRAVMSDFCTGVKIQARGMLLAHVTHRADLAATRASHVLRAGWECQERSASAAIDVRLRTCMQPASMHEMCYSRVGKGAARCRADEGTRCSAAAVAKTCRMFRNVKALRSLSS